MKKVDERIIKYKKLDHWNDAECSRSESLGNKKKFLSKTIEQTKKHFGTLGFHIPQYGELKHMSGLLRDIQQKITYDVTLISPLDDAKQVKYLISGDYLNNIINKLSVLVVGKNYNNAGKKYLAGLDVSPGLEMNCSADYLLMDEILTINTLHVGAKCLYSENESESVEQAKIDAVMGTSVSGVGMMGPFPKILLQNEKHAFEIQKIMLDDSVLIDFPKELCKYPIIHL